MRKNIALFIDGTWKEAPDQETSTNTNVHKLFLLAGGPDGQVCKFLNGIGTNSAPILWPKRFKRYTPGNLLRGAFGLGISDRIKDAYQFLSEQYVPGDHVFLFGFSRGAFAARSVAGFIDAVGLLLKKYADDERTHY